MLPNQTKADLTPARNRLVELMQNLNYGRITGLQIRDGEPVFGPPPSILRTHVLGKVNGPNPASANDTFALKRKVFELFSVFDREQTMTIRELVIENGLPLRIVIEMAVEADS